MLHIIRTNLLSLTGICIVAFSTLLFSFASQLNGIFTFASSILTVNTVFLSILIEALPFVLIGVLIAGMIQIFVTEEHIHKWIPKNKYLAIVMSCVVGALFPACECGIVPIVRRLVSKGVPIYAAIGFMLTGPLINPIVIASTYMAFGNDLQMAGLRMIVGFVIAMIIAFIISQLFKGNQLKSSLATKTSHIHETSNGRPFSSRFWSMLTHSIDEFFDMGKYLILGALLAAIVQTYMPAKTLLAAGDGPVASLAIMMGLAYILSLCSEADAFIGASFSTLFPSASVLGFLIFGPMMDLKNTIMMLSVFRFKFVMYLLALIATVVFIVMLFISKFI